MTNHVELFFVGFKSFFLSHRSVKYHSIILALRNMMITDKHENGQKHIEAPIQNAVTYIVMR